MNFNYSEEQNLLADSVIKFIQNDYNYEERRKRIASADGFDRDTWATFAELGWLAVPFAEEEGGIGGGPIETMIVMEEFGKGLVVEPYVSTVILAGTALKLAGNAQQKAELVGGIIEGNRQLTLAYFEPQARFDLFDIKTTAKKDAQGNYVINGTKGMVLNGGTADTLIVSVRTAGEQRDESGVSLLLVSADAKGVSIKSYPTLDGHRAAEVQFDDVTVPASALLGEEGNGLAVLNTVADVANLALCAEAVGMMEKLYKETVEYTKTRKQFGVAIAVFQALQHRMVDMFTLHAECKSLLLRAVMTYDTAQPDAARNIAALKYAIATKGQKVAHEAVQIFGGMGMTDEMSVGMYLKRINVINTLFGNGDYHLQRFMAA